MYMTFLQNSLYPLTTIHQITQISNNFEIGPQAREILRKTDTKLENNHETEFANLCV